MSLRREGEGEGAAAAGGGGDGGGWRRAATHPLRLPHLRADGVGRPCAGAAGPPASARMQRGGRGRGAAPRSLCTDSIGSGGGRTAPRPAPPRPASAQPRIALRPAGHGDAARGAGRGGASAAGVGGDAAAAPLWRPPGARPRAWRLGPLMWPLGPLARAAHHAVGPARRLRSCCNPAFVGGGGWYPEGSAEGERGGWGRFAPAGQRLAVRRKPRYGESLQRLRRVQGRGRRRGASAARNWRGAAGGGGPPGWWRKEGKAPCLGSLEPDWNCRLGQGAGRSQAAETNPELLGSQLGESHRQKKKACARKSPYYLISPFCTRSRFTPK